MTNFFKTSGRSLDGIALDERLVHVDRECNANAGIERVTQVIPAIDVIYVNVVGVVPTYRPRLNKSEPKAAVLKARISANHPWTADAESMPAPKIGTEPVVRYATAASGTEPQCWRCALPLHFGRTPLSMLLRLLLSALWLLLGLGLRLCLLLSVLWLLLGLGLRLCLLLSVLWLLLGLGLRLCLLLSALWLLLGLGLRLCLLLSALWLLLFRLRLLLLFRGLSLFFMLLQLCVRGSSGSEKKEQNSRADKSNWFHECCLHYGDFLRLWLGASGPIVISGHRLR